MENIDLIKPESLGIEKKHLIKSDKIWYFKVLKNICINSIVFKIIFFGE